MRKYVEFFLSDRRFPIIGKCTSKTLKYASPEWGLKISVKIV